MVYLTANETELHVTCKRSLADVRHAMLRVERFLRAGGFPEELRQDLNLALTEAMTNIARHGYTGEDGPISINLHMGAGAVQCRLTDRGAAFDPTMLGHALPDLEARPEGGYGWFLIRNLTRDLCYSHEDGVNTLRFTVSESL